MARRADHTREELRRLALDAARELTVEGGLRSLTTRKVAARIGYTVGTLYQLFQDADDMIEQMNGETLSALYRSCAGMDFGTGAAVSLKNLSKKYVGFTRANQRLWAAIFEHQLPEGREHSDGYLIPLLGLLGLIEISIAPYFSEGEEESRAHHARLLWASYYGINALAVTKSLSENETVESMVETLIAVHLAALEASAS